jgi:hypothetical protein
MKRYAISVFVLFIAFVFIGCGNSVTPQKPKSDVEVAKKFFGDLRSQALGFVNYEDESKDGALDKEIKGFGEALEKVSSDTNSLTKDLKELFSLMKNITDDSNTSINGDYNLTRVAVGKYLYKISPEYNGTLTIPDDINISANSLVNALISGTFSKGQKLDANATIGKSNINLKGILETNSSKLTINSFDINKSGDSVFVNEISVLGEIDGYKLDGDITSSNYVYNADIFANGGQIPSNALYTGSIQNIKTSAEINGSIELKVEDSIYNIAMSGKLLMPEHPVVDAEIRYHNDEEQNNNLNFSYKYEQTVINGATNFDKEGEDGVITLEGNDGISINIEVKNGQIVYGKKSYVKKDKKLVGTIEERNGVPVILYTDGTFESLS